MKQQVLKIGAFILALRIGPFLLAQTEDEAVKAAMYLNGASSPEEIDEGEVERIQSVFKVRVNSPGRGARAILSEYQLATLEDYRRHCGDILSWEELALVDGFSKETVEALKPFLSLYSKGLPGAVDTAARRLHGSGLARITDKNAGTKIKAEGHNWQVGVAARSKAWPLFSEDPDWTAHAEMNLGRWDIVLGDYNIRYGQGVGIWSGFSLTSLSTVGAFNRHATGISPVFSFLASEHRGVAVEYRYGRFTASVFGDIKGRYGSHVSYISIHGQAGLTLMSGLVSSDFTLNWKGVSISCELAAKGEGSFAGKGSASFKLGNTRFAFQGRALPTRFTGKKNGEYGLAAGAEWKSPSWRHLAGKSGFGSSVPAHVVSFTADASLLPKPIIDPGRKQLRLYGIWQWQMSGTLALDTRYTGRLRNFEPSRNDVRIDLKYNSGPWLSILRFEGDYSSGYGVLGYLEGGYKADNLSAYLRLTGFSTSGWSSRIYCYERDAPGSFLVPAYYGKGAVASLYGSLKLAFNHYRIKLYMRSSYTMNKDKANAFSLKGQAVLEY